MKTLSFSTLNMAVDVDTGMILLSVRSPGIPAVIVEMSADECMMFLVQLGNTLGTSREVQVTKRTEWTREYEERRRDDIREDSSEDTGDGYTEEID